MAIFKIEVTAYRCNICGYSWLPRYRDSPTPEVCAKCRSKYWNQPPRPEKQPRPPGHGLAADMINEIMNQQQRKQQAPQIHEEQQPQKEQYRHASVQQHQQPPKPEVKQEQPSSPVSKSRRDSDTPTKIERYLREDATDLVRPVDIAKVLNLDRHNTAYALSKLVKQGSVIQPVKGMYRHKDNSKVKQ